MVALENVVTAGFTVLALALVLVSLRAWWHTRSRKVALLTTGFAVLFLKGAFFTFRLFTDPDWERSSFLPGLFFDVVALVVFYVAVVKRSPA